MLRVTLDAVKAIAAREGCSVSHMAMQWCLANANVVCIIPGARNRAQLEANMLPAFEGMSPELKAELDKVTEGLKQALGSKIDPYQGDEGQRSF